MHVEGVLANNDYILNGCYIEITSNCNLRCIHCYNESGELRDQISVEAFKNVLGCYDNPKKASITLSGGEPLLHPQVWKFIDMMLESGILARNILLITNATCITDDVANMLAEKHVSVQVSLNGSRAELHDSICGKENFERTMAGLQRLLSKHANMVIVRNMMNKQNMNDNWDMFCEKLIDMGVHKIMLAGMKKEYTKVQDALTMVKIKGYGVVTPDREDIALEKPELIRHGNKFGVRIKASSPSIHMIRANIETEIAPIVGTEQQAQDLIRFIDQAEAEQGIWETNIFGKTVEQLVDDGITTKVASIGEESQLKLQDTMQKIVNDSNGGMVCIII